MFRHYQTNLVIRLLHRRLVPRSERQESCRKRIRQDGDESCPEEGKLRLAFYSFLPTAPNDTKLTDSSKRLAS
jgi:hypothetical protein